MTERRFQTCHVSRDSGVVEYLSQGEGTPMIFFPAMARSAHDFQGVADLLDVAEHRVVAVQPRGVGGSTGPLEDITLFDMADDVAAVIRDVADGPVIVVGHAFGNWVARCLAVKRPELVRALVLAAASREGAVDAGLRAALEGSFDSRLGRAERCRHLQRLFFAPGNDPSCWLDGWYPKVAEFQRAAGARTERAQWWTGGDRVPILDLHGDADPTCPRDRATEYRDKLGGSRVTIRVLRNASHAMFPERPMAVAMELNAFALR